MAATVQDILDILEDIAPQQLAEEWDNIGLLLGEPTAQVTGLLLALDPLPELIDQAMDLGANLIVTHHPVIFQPLDALRTDLATGRLLQKALATGISMIGCHTNLDAAPGGVNDVLASCLGLTRVAPLVPCLNEKPGCGMGRIGQLPEPLGASQFLELLKRTCDLPWLLAAGRPPEQVHRVAVCGGSGSDLAEAAWQAGADVYVTAEVKHAVARWAESTGIWLIDGGHFGTENLVISRLRDELIRRMQTRNLALPVHCAVQHSPLQAV